MYHIDDTQNYSRVQRICRLLRRLFIIGWYNVLIDIQEHKFVVYHNGDVYMSSEYLDDIYKTLAGDVLIHIKNDKASMKAINNISPDAWLRVVFFLDVDNVDNPFIPLLKWLTESEVYRMSWFNIAEWQLDKMLSHIDEFFYSDKEFYFVP